MNFRYSRCIFSAKIRWYTSSFACSNERGS